MTLFSKEIEFFDFFVMSWLSLSCASSCDRQCARSGACVVRFPAGNSDEMINFNQTTFNKQKVSIPDVHLKGCPNHCWEVRKNEASLTAQRTRGCMHASRCARARMHTRTQTQAPSHERQRLTVSNNNRVRAHTHIKRHGVICGMWCTGIYTTTNHTHTMTFLGYHFMKMGKLYLIQRCARMQGRTLRYNTRATS